jgi:hypothetical protein
MMLPGDLCLGAQIGTVCKACYQIGSNYYCSSCCCMYTDHIPAARRKAGARDSAPRNMSKHYHHSSALPGPVCIAAYPHALAPRRPSSTTCEPTPRTERGPDHQTRHTGPPVLMRAGRPARPIERGRRRGAGGRAPRRHRPPSRTQTAQN